MYRYSNHHSPSIFSSIRPRTRTRMKTINKNRTKTETLITNVQLNPRRFKRFSENQKNKKSFPQIIFVSFNDSKVYIEYGMRYMKNRKQRNLWMCCALFWRDEKRNSNRRRNEKKIKLKVDESESSGNSGKS